MRRAVFRLGPTTHPIGSECEQVIESNTLVNSIALKTVVIPLGVGLIVLVSVAVCHSFDELQSGCRGAITMIAPSLYVVGSTVFVCWGSGKKPGSLKLVVLILASIIWVLAFYWADGRQGCAWILDTIAENWLEARLKPTCFRSVLEL